MKHPIGIYKRDGEANKMVNENSALLNLPNEHRIPVQLDHSMMVKFTNNRDSPYHSVIGHLRQVLKDIPHVISKYGASCYVCSVYMSLTGFGYRTYKIKTPTV